MGDEALGWSGGQVEGEDGEGTGWDGRREGARLCRAWRDMLMVWDLIVSTILNAIYYGPVLVS